jgi:hypothetical protein
MQHAARFCVKSNKSFESEQEDIPVAVLSIGTFVLGLRCKGNFTESESFGIVNQQALLFSFMLVNMKTNVELLE